MSRRRGFVQAWRKLDTFRGEAAVFTWLCRIAVNEALARPDESECRSLSSPGERRARHQRPEQGTTLDTAPRRGS